jgi:DNA-binding transcriptional LysR family regulator
MHTDQLRLFLTILRHRSLSRAAAELDLGQATVSERLKALEAELKTTLFERRGRGVTLTPSGEAFKPYAERALEVLREAQDSVRAASAGHTGQVSIAVTVTSGAYLFAPALVAFQREHPGVEVKVRSAHSWDAPGLLLDGVAHLALVSGPITLPQIETVATFTGRMRLVTGRRHASRLARPTLPQLARETFLVSYWGPASQRFLDRVRAAAAEKTGPWMELSPVELVKGMLMAGTGVSLVPEIAVRRELAAGDLVSLEVADPDVRLPPWEITLIRQRSARQNTGPRPAPTAADALAETLVRVLPTLTQ